jgi:hypothetical protein
MLYVVERINRECGSHFDFVVNSIFPQLTQCLEESSQTFFSAADPDIFHARYSSWLKFLAELESDLSKTSEHNLKNSPAYQQFSSRWDVIVYYQIRFLDISNAIENVLVNQPFTLNEENSATYRTLIASTIFECIERCWHSNCFLEPLAHQFWKLTLQCIVRFRVWIETFNAKTMDMKFLLNLYVDLKRFSDEVKTFFQTVILGQRLASMTSAAPSITAELTNGKEVHCEGGDYACSALFSPERHTRWFNRYITSEFEELSDRTVDSAMQRDTSIRTRHSSNV